MSFSRRRSRPRRGIAESLVRDIPANACAVAYNMGFERAVLKDLAEAFDDLSGHLLAVRDNMVDLIVPFRNGSCYAAAQNGSFSIKAVLPALFPDDPDLNYRSLEGVHDGAQASRRSPSWRGWSLTPHAGRARTSCGIASSIPLAMVRIWQWLEDAVARAGESEPEGAFHDQHDEDRRRGVSCAARACGQVDKAGEPYILHVLAVAEAMDDESTCAALLHDVVEDGGCSLDDLRAIGMSEAVVEAVRLLTHDPADDYFSLRSRASRRPDRFEGEARRSRA